jgi:polyhydroxyalkanoate synthesis regulator phasin
MNGTLNQLAAQEHVNDLLREAERERLTAQARPPRRLGPAWQRLSVRWMHRRHRHAAPQPTTSVESARSCNLSLAPDPVALD